MTDPDDKEKKPHYVEGVGWRYDTEHRTTRRHRSHRYWDIGTYEITFATVGRMPLLGELKGKANGRKGTGEYPHVELSPIGMAILHEELPKINRYYPMMKVWTICIMPDHIHMIIRVEAPLPDGKHLGQVIGAFKGGCSRAWWKMADSSEVPVPKASASGKNDDEWPWEDMPQQEKWVVTAYRCQNRKPLFEEIYNDQILMREGQLENWKRYLQDNPLRAIIRKEHPDIMQRVLRLTIGDRCYAAFGNLFLLKRPEKHQVFFHRKTMVNGTMVPTETTDAFAMEKERLLEAARNGDVLVTPGISKGELALKNAAIEERLPLIHLQKEPIGPYWKPERSRFYACAAGTLLILAPLQETEEDSSDYQQFHDLNERAREICEMSGEGVRFRVVKRQADA